MTFIKTEKIKINAFSIFHKTYCKIVDFHVPLTKITEANIKVKIIHVKMK